MFYSNAQVNLTFDKHPLCDRLSDVNGFIHERRALMQSGYHTDSRIKGGIHTLWSRFFPIL